MHRSVLLVILSTVIIALLSVSSSYDAFGDEAQDEISYADMVFTIVDNNDVELTGISDPDLETAVIPATFEEDGRTYTVIGVNGPYIYHDLVNRIMIPSTVTYVKGNFYGLSALEYIDVDPYNEHLCSVDGVLYDFDVTTIIAYPMLKSDVSYDMPDTVTVVSGYCFAGAEKLESITLSDKIVLIDTYAFDMCTSLEKINHDGTINHLPNTLRIIGESAFNNCEKLTDIELPQSLMIIGGSAFNQCIGLTSMLIPYEVVDIGTGFLNGCINIESIEVSEFNTHFETRDGVLYVIHNNSSSSSLHTYPCGKPDKSFKVPDDVGSIEPLAFCGTAHLEKLILSNGMRSIGSYAIYGCETLQEVYIPSSVISVNNMAFCMCSSLTTVKGGNNVSIIDIMAFNSTKLTTAFLPDALRIIEAYAFEGCDGITEVTLPESIESVGSCVFSQCFNLTTITILGIDTVMMNESLCIGTEDRTAEIRVIIPDGMQLPDNVFDEYTIAHVSIIGEEPYPYENLIGVAICLLVLFFIIRLFREV